MTSTSHFTAKLIEDQKTVGRIYSDSYSGLVANVVCALESDYPAGIGLIRDNEQGYVVQRIKCATIVD